jgi:hypothetical protein
MPPLSKHPPKPLRAIGETVTLIANAHRYHGGPAVVIRHECRGEVRPRWGMVVKFRDREIWVVPGECADFS